MFSGLVQSLATIDHVEPMEGGKRFAIAAEELAKSAAIGDSICVSGCCLTVVEIRTQVPGLLLFEAGQETLSKTKLGSLEAGSRVNLESSLAIGDKLGGHLVTGHVDGLGTLTVRDNEADWSTMTFEADTPLMRQMASKGSIAVDGVSLTLVDVTHTSFSVALIPHTLSVTTLGELSLGDKVNLETDVLAKYVERQLAFASPENNAGVTS